MIQAHPEMTWCDYYRQLMQRRRAPKPFIICTMVARSNLVLQQLTAPTSGRKHIR